MSERKTSRREKKKNVKNALNHFRVAHTPALSFCSLGYQIGSGRSQTNHNRSDHNLSIYFDHLARHQHTHTSTHAHAHILYRIGLSC